MKFDYESYDDVLSDLILLKDTFWCHQCERGLFCPKTCSVHVENEDVVEDSDVDDDTNNAFLYWEILPHNLHVREIMPHEDTI
jgi:ferredoxin